MIIYLLIALPLAVAALSGIIRRQQSSLIGPLAVVAGAAEAILGVMIAARFLAEGEFVAGAFFAVDGLGAFFLSFAVLVGLAAAVYSAGYLREEMRKGIIGFSRLRQYFMLFHLFFFALFVAVLSAVPLLTWVGIEATTLATAFLISFYNKPSALEAGWKHLIVNSAGLLIGFLGVTLFLAAVANAGAGEGLISWAALPQYGALLEPGLTALAFVFILIGFGTKAGFVPLHTWLPDAHGKAPAPISALLSGLLLNAALIAILRFRAVVDLALNPSFSRTLLLSFGIVSLVVAAFIMLIQKNYKRMLAYSSIEHMGVITLGVGVGGAALPAALFHMLYHALLKPILFFAAGNIFLKYSSTKIIKVRGALTPLPISAALFFGALLAVAGAPFSGIFFTKLAILSAGMHAYPALMLVALGGFTLVFAGFMNHLSSMLFGEPPTDLVRGEYGAYTLMPLLFLAVLFIVLSFWVPHQLAELVQRAAAIIR